MFGATKSINTMVIDPIQYLDLVNKLEEDAYRGIVDCDFFKIFTKYGPDGLSKGWGKAGVYRETIQAGTKKAYRAYHPIGFNFKYSS